MAQPTKPAAKKRAAKKPPVVKAGKKTQLYTEGQWKELENSHENYRKAYLDQVGELEAVRQELKQANNFKKEIKDAEGNDMKLEMLAIRLLRQRSPKLRAFILSRIVDATKFGLESESIHFSNEARELEKRSTEYWNRAGEANNASSMLVGKNC